MAEYGGITVPWESLTGEDIVAILNRLAYGGRNVLAGVTDMALSSPQAVEELGGLGAVVPSGVWQLGSLVEMGLDRLGAVLTPGDQPMDPANFGAMTRYANSAVEQSNEMLDVNVPNSAAELIERSIGLPLRLPIPSATSLAGQIAGGAARIATPGIQSRSIPGVAVEGIAIPSAVSAVIETLDPAGYGQPLPDPAPMIDVASEQTLSDLITGDVPDIAAESSVVPSLPPHRPMRESYQLGPDGQWVPISSEPLLMTPDEQVDRDYTNELVGLGIAGLGIIGGAAGRAALAGRRGAAVANNSVLMGQVPTEPAVAARDTTIQVKNPESFGGPDSFTPRSTMLETQFIDQRAPIRHALEQATGRQQAGEVLADMRTTITPAAFATKNDNFFTTGRFIDSDVRATPMRRIMNAMARLDPQRYALLQDAAIAETRLHDMAQLGTRVWGRTAANQVNDIDLQNISAAARRDPQIAQILDEMFEQTKAAARYMEQGRYGIIDQATRDSWLDGKYLPIKRDVETPKPGLLSYFKLTEPELGTEVPEYLKPGGRAAKVLNETEPGEVRSPVESLVDYLSRIQRYTTTNRIRGRILDTLSGSGRNLRRKDGGQLITSHMTSKPNDMTQVVTVLKRGVPHYYTVRDPALYSALQFTPGQIIPALNITRQVGQQFTTGAFNPFFVLRSMMYEAFAGMMLTKPGRGGGEIDRLLGDISEALTGKRIYLSNLRLPDPSMLLSGPIGAVDTIVAQMKPWLAEKLDLQLRFGGGLKAVIGDRGLRIMRDVIMRSFERSTKSEMERLGADNAAFYSSDPFGGVPSDILHLAPDLGRRYATSVGKQAAASRTWRLYNHVLGALHGGTRLVAFRANRPHGYYVGNGNFMGRKVPVINVSADEIALADDIRRLTSDPTQVPGDPNTFVGKAVQLNVSGSMFLNHAIQAIAQNVRGMREFPTKYFTSMGVIAYGVVQLLEEMFEANEEFEKTYTQDMTAAQRTRMLPLAGDDAPGGVKAVLNLPQEMRLWLGPFIEAYLAFTGRTGNPTANTRMIQGFARDQLFEFTELDLARLDASLGQALQGLTPDPFGNPALRAAYTMFSGVRPPQWGMGNYSVQEPWRNRADPFDDGQVDIGERFKMAMEELLAGASRPLIDMGTAMSESLEQGNNLSGAIDDAANNFFAGFREPESTGPFTGMWGLDMRMATTTPEHNLRQAATQAIEGIMKAGTMTVRSPSGADTGRPGFPVYTYNPNAQGSELEIVRNYAAGVDNLLGRIGFFNKMGELQTNLAGLDINAAYSDPEVRRIEANRIVEEMRKLDREALSIIRQHEYAAGQALGDPDFSFALYDPREGSTRPLPLQ